MDSGKRHLLVIRADADPRMGTGHFMRSLALGEAWKYAGGDVAFLTTCRQEAMLQRLERERFDVYRIAEEHPDPRDLRETLTIARAEGAGWVSLDGYFFDPSYHDGITRSGFRLLVFDDNAHLARYSVDVLLNQNVHARDLVYHTRRTTRRLLGTRYVILRREFLDKRPSRRRVPGMARHLLVTMGGSDPDNLTSRVLAEIGRVDVEGFEATVVIGPANPRLVKLRRAAGRSRHRIRVMQNVEDMANLMAAADLAVCAGGTTLWELAYFGVPALVFTVAENQRLAVTALEGRGMLKDLGETHNIDWGSLGENVEALARDAASRSRMTRVGRSLVDGAGGARVIKTLTALRED